MRVVVWLSRIFTLLAAGCFFIGLRQGTIQYKRYWVTSVDKTQPLKEKHEVSVAPKEQATRIAPFETVYDVIDGISHVFRRGQAGVIITDASTERSITVEFYWHRLRLANGVNIEFAASATIEAAMMFTIEDVAKYEHIVLERRLFRDMLLFLHQHAKETNEVSSGRRVYRGILP